MTIKYRRQARRNCQHGDRIVISMKSPLLFTLVGPVLPRLFRRHKLITRQICLTLGLLCTMLLNSAPVQAKEKIRVAISSFSASYISMFIAQKRGYYAEEGLAVDIILMAGLTGTRALIGNSVEFGSASNPTAAV